MRHQNFKLNILYSDAHEGGQSFFLSKVESTQNPRWLHVYVEIQDDRYFWKIVYVITDP